MKLETDSQHNLNDQLMSLAAFRYCIGRRSYIVGACIDWLYDTWEQFSDQTKLNIVRDTIESLMDNNADENYFDDSVWVLFASTKYKALTDAQRLWVDHAVSYKNKPMPW